jgi:hypothetical protein
MKVKIVTNGAAAYVFPISKGESVRFGSPQKAVNYCNENDLEVVNKDELATFYSMQLKK